MSLGREGRWADRPTARPRRHGRADRGSATAELAVALPALILLTLVAVTAVAALLTKLQCVDAAREAARTAARGEPGAAAGSRVAPSGAAVSVSVDGELARAIVRVDVRPLGGRLPGFAVSATAVAAVEPGVSGS